MKITITRKNKKYTWRPHIFIRNIIITGGIIASLTMGVKTLSQAEVINEPSAEFKMYRDHGENALDFEAIYGNEWETVKANWDKYIK